VPWATIITSTGALLGGLAIVLAFVQLGAQHEDRLRAQVSKVSIWTQTDDTRTSDERTWPITLFIRNTSELPVEVHKVVLAVGMWQYTWPHDPPNPLVGRREHPGGTEFQRFYPGTVPPEHTSQYEGEFKAGPFHLPVQLRIRVVHVAITDAAGRHWNMRPSWGGLPRRVPQRRRFGWPDREPRLSVRDRR
jgi:hypothetical protein